MKAMSVQIDRRVFSVDDYYRMAEVGLLREDERVELIEGSIVKMSPVSSRHAACVSRLNALFNKYAGERVIISVHNPVRLDEFSEPQPDVALLKPRADFYAGAHPAAVDVLLIAEVSDTTIGYDRQVKVPLYARAGVPEVWVIDLENETVETYAQPRDGAYELNACAARGERIGGEMFAGEEITAEAIIG
jgi:Uma2 family endonuclease